MEHEMGTGAICELWQVVPGNPARPLYTGMPSFPRYKVVGDMQNLRQEDSLSNGGVAPKLGAAEIFRV